MKFLMRLARPIFVRLLKEFLADKDMRPLVVEAVKDAMTDTVQSVIKETAPDTLVEWIGKKI